MRDRSERTLRVDAEVRLGPKVLATCEATMVLVDGERWSRHARELLDG